MLHEKYKHKPNKIIRIYTIVLKSQTKLKFWKFFTTRWKLIKNWIILRHLLARLVRMAFQQTGTGAAFFFSFCFLCWISFGVSGCLLDALDSGSGTVITFFSTFRETLTVESLLSGRSIFELSILRVADFADFEAFFLASISFAVGSKVALGTKFVVSVVP